MLVAEVTLIVPLACASNYNFTTIDYPGAYYTFVTDNNNFGHLVGEYSVVIKCHGFLYDGNKFITIDPPVEGEPSNLSINDNGQITLQVRDIQNWITTSFLYDGSSFTKIEFPGATSTRVMDINNDGHLVGSSSEGNFWYDGTNFTLIEFPGASWTEVYSISNDGHIAGVYGIGNIANCFVFDGVNYTTIYFDPSCDDPETNGINNAGQIVILCANLTYSFLYEDGKLSLINVPGSSSTTTRGINDAGQIVGIYRDTNNIHHGFVATPAPLDADFSATPLSGYSPLTVKFSDQSTGNITSWQWNFGDGSMSTEQNPNHTYVEAGTYTVIITVTGTAGSETEAKANYINVRERKAMLWIPLLLLDE